MSGWRAWRNELEFRGSPLWLELACSYHSLRVTEFPRVMRHAGNWELRPPFSRPAAVSLLCVRPHIDFPDNSGVPLGRHSQLTSQ